MLHPQSTMNHGVVAYVVQTAAERTAMTGFPAGAAGALAAAFTQYDVQWGKLVHQLDTDTFWRTTTYPTATWEEWRGSASGGQGVAGVDGSPGEPGAQGRSISPDGKWACTVPASNGMTTLHTLTPKVMGPAIVVLGFNLYAYQQNNFAIWGMATYYFPVRVAADGTLAFANGTAPSMVNPTQFPSAWTTAVALSGDSRAVLLRLQPSSAAVNTVLDLYQGEEQVMVATSLGAPDAADQPPTGAFVLPLPGFQWVIGRTYPIRVTASDPDGAIDRIRLLEGGTVEVCAAMPLTANGGQYNYTVVGPARPLSLTAEIHDVAGASGHFTAGPVVGAIVAAAATNSAPVVALTSPATGFQAVLGQTITFMGSATVTDGTLQAVTIRRGSTVIETIVNPPQGAFSIPHTIVGADVGSQTFSAEAVGSNGLTGTSASIVGTILETGSLPAPTASITAPAGAFDCTVGVSVAFAATVGATAPATVQSARLLRGSTVIETMTLAGNPPTSATCNHIPTAGEIGTANYTVQVTDTNGSTGSSSALSGTTGAAPTATIQVPAASFSATEGGSFTVSGVYTLQAGRTVSSIWIRLNGSNWVQATADAGAFTMTRTLQAGDVGPASLVARITDSVGATADSPAVSGVINDAPSDTLWSDNFDGTDANPIGNGWTGVNGGNAARVSNEMVRTDDGSYRIVYNAAGGSLPANYYVEWEIPEATLSGGWLGVVARYVHSQAGYIGAGVQVFMQTSRTTLYVGDSDGSLGVDLNNRAVTVTGGFPASWSQAQNHRLGILFSGTTATIYLDRSEYGWFTTSLNNQVGTEVGNSGAGGNRHWLNCLVATAVPT